MAALAVISLIIGGFSAVAIGLLMSPLTKEFSWPAALTAGAATAFNLAALLLAAPVGIAVDRLGARAVMGTGIVICSIGYALVSVCQTPCQMLVGFALTGVGFCATSFVPAAVVATTIMGSKKGLGTGIIWGSVSGGAALFSVVMGRAIDAYGWRLTTGMLALCVIGLLPVCLKTLTHGAGASAHKMGQRSRTQKAWIHAEWLWSTEFIMVAASSSLFAIGMIGLYYHLVPLLIKAGYSAPTADSILGLSWVLSGVGSFLLGPLADRKGARTTLAIALAASALGTLALLGVGEARIGTLCGAAFVLAWGASANSVYQLVPVLFAKRFGPSDLGSAVGAQSAIMGLVAAAAPVLIGLLYDRFGDYRIAIWVSAGSIALASIVAVLIRSPSVAGETRTCL